MADPLSIAGSVVGITAAGVQASVKLYALAEKVATASQRVTSIADDVSSTCAILNQVRELIVPQPDAQGTLKSVFTSIALHDISHALQRCRSVFTEIELLLGRAFEQMGKRHAFHSKIHLSRFEKTKWPFLQPQFDDLRTDLRDSKGNLILMIAVASLALARRDGHQRPVHARERLELGSTIVQLERARTMKTHNGNTSTNLPRQRMGLLKHFGIRRNVKTKGSSMVERGQETSREHIPESRTVSKMPASPPELQQDATVSSVVGESGGFPPRSNSIDLLGLSPAPNRNARTQEQGLLNDSILSHGITEINLANLPSISSPKGPARLQESRYSYEREEILSLSQEYPEELTVSSSTSDPTLELALLNTLAATPSDAYVWDNKWYYKGWSTDYLTGLRTGYGNSLLLCPMNLPDRSLERLVKAYKDQDLDPYVTMLELTQKQKEVVTQTYTTILEAELVYINLPQKTTINSVFGVLEITTLKWIVASRTPFPLEKSSSMRVVPPSSHRTSVSSYSISDSERGEIEIEEQCFDEAPMRHAAPNLHFVRDHHLPDYGNRKDSAREHARIVGQGYAVPVEDNRPHELRKELFSRFRRHRDTVHLLDHSGEKNEDDIVDELLARWTIS